MKLPIFILVMMILALCWIGQIIFLWRNAHEVKKLAGASAPPATMTISEAYRLGAEGALDALELDEMERGARMHDLAEKAKATGLTSQEIHDMLNEMHAAYTTPTWSESREIVRKRLKL